MVHTPAFGNNTYHTSNGRNSGSTQLLDVAPWMKAASMGCLRTLSTALLTTSSLTAKDGCLHHAGTWRVHQAQRLNGTWSGHMFSLSRRLLTTFHNQAASSS